MEYKCSKCGGEVTHAVLLTYPAQHSYVCQKCGAKRIDREKQDGIITVEMPGEGKR